MLEGQILKEKAGMSDTYYLKQRLADLNLRHDKLHVETERLARAVGPSSFELTRKKRDKLALKDEIVRIEKCLIRIEAESSVEQVGEQQQEMSLFAK
jgi:hypothetical protein